MDSGEIKNFIAMLRCRNHRYFTHLSGGTDETSEEGAGKVKSLVNETTLLSIAVRLKKIILQSEKYFNQTGKENKKTERLVQLIA